MSKKAIKNLLLLALFPSLLSGCGTTTYEVTDNPDDYVKLTMWVPCAGGLEPNDNAKILSSVNEYLKTALPNTELVVKYEDSNSFGAVMTRMFGAEEKFDICFTSYATNDYFNNAEDDTFVGFTEEQLIEYAPHIYNYYTNDLWDMIKVNDKYYGVINNQIRARQAGVSLDTLTLKKFLANAKGSQDFNSITAEEIATFAQATNSFEDLEEYLQYAYDLNNGRYRFITSMMDMECMMYYMGFDDFGRYNVPGVLPMNATSADDIVNQFETDEFKNLLKTFKGWFGKYVDSSVLSGGITSSTYPTLAMRCLGTYKPGVEQEEYNICFKDMTAVSLKEKVLTTTSCLTTMSAVSYTSPHPARALKFLDLLFSDAKLYNMLAFGREGIDYVVKSRDENENPTQIEQFSTAKYKVNNAWSYGNQFLAYPTSKQPLDVWEQSKNFDKDAQKSLAYGFIFDEKPVASEIASCINVYSTYFMQLINDTDPNGSQGDQDFYNDFLNQLKKAGSDRIIAELKSQLTSWLNNK